MGDIDRFNRYKDFNNSNNTNTGTIQRVVDSIQTSAQKEPFTPSGESFGGGGGGSWGPGKPVPKKERRNILFDVLDWGAGTYSKAQNQLMGGVNFMTEFATRELVPSLWHSGREIEKTLDKWGLKGKEAYGNLFGDYTEKDRQSDYYKMMAENQKQDARMTNWVNTYKKSYDKIKEKEPYWFLPTITEVGKESTEIVAKANEPEWVEEFNNLSLKDRFGKDFGKTLYMTSQDILASLAVVYLTGKFTGSNLLGSSILGASTGEEIKQSCIENGGDRSQCNTLGMAAAVPTTILEKFGWDNVLGGGMLKKWGIGYFGKILQATVVEGLTELTQEEIQMMAESTFREIGVDERVTRDIMATFGGVLGGGFISGGNIAFNHYGTSDANLDVAQVINQQMTENPAMKKLVLDGLNKGFNGKVLKDTFVEGVITDVEEQIKKYNGNRSVELTEKFEDIKKFQFNSMHDLVQAISDSLPADIDAKTRKLYIEQAFQRAVIFGDPDMSEIAEGEFIEYKEGDKKLFGLLGEDGRNIFEINPNNMPLSQILDEPRESQKTLDSSAIENNKLITFSDKQLANKILPPNASQVQYEKLAAQISGVKFKQESAPVKELAAINQKLDKIYKAYTDSKIIATDPKGNLISGYDTLQQAVKDGRESMPVYVGKAVDENVDLTKFPDNLFIEKWKEHLETIEKEQAEKKREEDIEKIKESLQQLVFQNEKEETGYQDYRSIIEEGGKKENIDSELLKKYRDRHDSEVALLKVAKETYPSSFEVSIGVGNLISAIPKTAKQIVKAATIKGKTAPSDTKPRIKKITEPTSPFVKRRTATLLKEKLRSIARGAKIGDRASKNTIKKIHNELYSILRDSELSAKDREKFTKAIDKIQTQKQLDNFLPTLEERIGGLIEKAKKRLYLNRITTELKSIKPRKQSGRPVGKFTPEIQKVLNQFVEASKLSEDEASLKIQDNLAKTKAGISSFEMALENKILEIGSGLNEKTSDELLSVLQNIKSLKNEGKMLNELAKFNRQEEIDRQKEKAIAVITGNKGISSGIDTEGIKEADVKGVRNRILKHLKRTGKSMSGWRDIMDMLSTFDKGSSTFKSWLNEKMDVLDQTNAEKDGQSIQFKKANKMLVDIYGLKSDRDIAKLIAEYNKEVDLGVFVREDGTKVNLKYTKAEAIKRYMEFQDETLDETWIEGNLFTTEMMNSITNMLSSKDKQFGDAILDFYAEYRPSINEIYETMNGTSLGDIDNYSPIMREGFEDNQTGTSEFLREVPYRASINTKSSKQRVKNILPIAKQSVFASLEKHIVEAEHYKAWAEKLRDIKSVLQSSKVKTAITVNHGKAMNGIVNNFLEDFTRGGADMSSRLNWLDKFRGQYTRAVLSLKTSIGIKQLTSQIAYANYIPVKEYVAGTVAFWKNPIKNAKFLKQNSILLRERGQNIERDIKAAMKSNEAANFMKNPSFINKLMLNVKLGDQGAIVMGGWSVYRYYKNKHYSEERAIKEFEKATNPTQQSADLAEQSKMQRGGPFAKLFTMFQSSPNQYFRQEMAAVRGLLSGRGSKVQHAKTIMIFHFLIPMLFQFATDGFKWEPTKQLRAGVLGAYNGIFIVGDMLESVLDKLFGNKVYPNEVPIYGIVDDIIKFMKFLDGDLSEEEVLSAIKGAAGATGSLTGLPLKYGVSLYDGIKKMIEGDGTGFTDVLGFPSSSSSSSKKSGGTNSYYAP